MSRQVVQAYVPQTYSAAATTVVPTGTVVHAAPSVSGSGFDLWIDWPGVGPSGQAPAMRKVAAFQDRQDIPFEAMHIASVPVPMPVPPGWTSPVPVAVHHIYEVEVSR